MQRVVARLLLALVVTGLASGCGGGDPDSSPTGPAILELGEPRVVVSEESAWIAEGVDLELDELGNLFVVDYRVKQVLLISPDGGEPTIIGRPGEGPGEFVYPYAVAARGGTVWLLDISRGNLQSFDYEGVYLGESALPINAAGIQLSGDGRLAYNEQFSEIPALVEVVDFEGNALMNVGTLVVEPTTFVDFTVIKEEIARGRVPDALRNNAIAELSPAGGVWVFQQTEGKLERFDAEGNLAAEAQLDIPEQEAILERFKRRNGEANSGSLAPLRYVIDAKAVGDRLWLSWDVPPGTPNIVTVHGPDGRPTHRIGFPIESSIGRFAVDPERRLLYLYIRDDSSIVAFDLPEEVF